MILPSHRWLTKIFIFQIRDISNAFDGWADEVRKVPSEICHHVRRWKSKLKANSRVSLVRLGMVRLLNKKRSKIWPSHFFKIHNSRKRGWKNGLKGLFDVRRLEIKNSKIENSVANPFTTSLLGTKTRNAFLKENNIVRHNCLRGSKE